MPLDELIAAAELGEESRRFLESDLGKCILGMAEQQVKAAQEDLENTSPTDTEKIRELQNKARMGRAFEGWLRELFHDGEAAIAIYRQDK